MTNAAENLTILAVKCTGNNAHGSPDIDRFQCLMYMVRADAGKQGSDPGACSRRAAHEHSCSSSRADRGQRSRRRLMPLPSAR